MISIYLLIAVGFYLFFCLLVVFLQRRLQYFPTHFDSGLEGGRTFIPWPEKGSNFLGYIKTAPDANRVVVFFHGNGGEALDRSWLANLLREGPVHLILAEFPGYGGMAGSPTEKSILQAGEKLIDLTQKTWDLPITVLGESLGSGVACYLAAKKKVDRLALISPFSSVLDVAKHHYPYLPVGLLMQDKFLSSKWATEIKIPVHIIHGTDDDIVPIRFSRKLFEAIASEPKHFTELEGANHNDIAAAILLEPKAAAFRSFLLGKD